MYWRSAATVVLSICLFSSGAWAGCEPLRSTSICSSILDYSYVGVQDEFEYNNGNHTGCQEYPEWALTKREGAPVIWGILSPECRKWVALLHCHQTYPNCYPTLRLTPCQSICYNISAACVGTDLFILGQANPPFNPAYCPAWAPDGPNCYHYGQQTSAAIQVPLPRCEEYRGNVCRGIINYPIYLQPGSTQEQFEQLVMSALGVYHIATIKNGCREALAQYICLGAFPKCDTTAVGQAIFIPSISVPFPRFGCRGVCTDYLAKCEGFLQLLDAMGPNPLRANCTARVLKDVACNVTMNDGFEQFPVTSTHFGGGASPVITTQCNEYSAAEVAAINVPVRCPDGLNVIEDRDSPNSLLGGSCGLRCPSDNWTDDDWDANNAMFQTLTITSFILSTFMLLTWLIFPVKRNQKYVLCFSIAIFCVSLDLLINLIQVPHGHLKYMGCKNGTDAWRQPDGSWCVVSGFFLYYFAMCAMHWWFIQALDLFLKITLMWRWDPAQEKIKNRRYYIFGFVVPAVAAALVFIDSNGYGGLSFFSWCFVQGSEDWIQYAAFYGPCGAYISVGAVMMVSVMRTLYKSAKATSVRRPWRQNIRPVIFIIQFMLLFSIFFADRVSETLRQPDIEASVIEWVTCLFSPPPLGGSRAACGSRFKVTLNKELYFAASFAVSGQGIINFLTYGTQINNFKLWWAFLTCRGTTLDLGSTADASGGSQTGSGRRNPASPRGSKQQFAELSSPSASNATTAAVSLELPPSTEFSNTVNNPSE